MRILFMGTPDFAENSLRHLIDGGYDVCGVFTQPDKPRGRGMKMEACPVKKLALENNIPVFQPVSLRTGEAMQIIESLKPDLIAVVAYGKILPKEMLDYPKFGCINIHGSILPKYRGAAPIQWAVINGEEITGVTAMYMSEGMDEGDIISVKETEIGKTETAGELFDRLSEIGGKLLCETINAIEFGAAGRTPQDSALATYAPPLKKDICPIRWDMTPKKIVDHVRGLCPWPVATAYFEGINFKIFKAEEYLPSDDELLIGKKPGDIISADKNGIAVACFDGSVIIKELQAPGGKRMSAGDYLRGHPLW